MIILPSNQSLIMIVSNNQSVLTIFVPGFLVLFCSECLQKKRFFFNLFDMQISNENLMNMQMSV